MRPRRLAIGRITVYGRKSMLYGILCFDSLAVCCLLGSATFYGYRVGGNSATPSVKQKDFCISVCDRAAANTGCRGLTHTMTAHQRKLGLSFRVRLLCYAIALMTSLTSMQNTHSSLKGIMAIRRYVLPLRDFVSYCLICRSASVKLRGACQRGSGDCRVVHHAYSTWRALSGCQVVAASIYARTA